MYKFLLCFVILCSTSVFGQSLVGRVYVGSSTDDDTTLYSFNQNYNFSLEIPVYPTVEDGLGNEVEPPTSIVMNVTCGLVTENVPGYSQVVFSTVDVILEPLSNSSTVVPFMNMVAGRMTGVQCWGVSESTTEPHFTKDSSVANVRDFEVRPPGTVSICNKVVVVSNILLSKSTIVVELSEPIESGNVTITCQTETIPVNSVDVTFDPVTISSGQRAEVTYTVISTSEIPVMACCSAETILGPGDGDNIQFDPQASGECSQFVQDTGTVQFVPTLTQLRATQLKAYLVLDAPVPARSTVEFVCTLEVTTDLSLANNITESTECISLQPPAQPAPSGNATDGWNLREEVIRFTDGIYFRPVEIFRQGSDVYNQPYRPEVVVVHCCAPDSINSVEKYLNESASFITAVYLSPNVTTNWDIATDPANGDTETVIKEPQYVEVSPCPCDLTNFNCDINCCCDSYCSEVDKSTFQCITGIQGGAEYNEISRHDCTADYFNMPDWFPFMCVQFENNAFLGFFRQPVPAIRTLEYYVSQLNIYEPDYSFQQPVSPDPIEVNSTIAGYQDGVSIKTGLPTKQVIATLQIGPNYRLALPGRSLAGECVFSNPVRFARESDENCVWTMSENLCSTASPLNALNYALPTIGTEPLCRKGLLLLKEQENEEVGITNVDYHCAGSSNSAYMKPYLRSTDAIKDRLPEDQIKLFDDELLNDGEDCDFDLVTGAYICPNVTSSPRITSSLPPRCDWDTGYVKAPIPQLNTSGDIPVCTNAVLEVRYNFTWRGPQVILLNATIVLGDVPLLQEKTENATITDQNGTSTETIVTNFTTLLTQLTAVQWNHEMNESLKSEVINTTLARGGAPYKRSGILGYELDSSVFSGVSVLNATTDEFIYMDRNSTNELSLWKAGADSLCETSSREPVLFRQNAMGSCLLRLRLEELKNCTYLRKLVLNQQDELMLSSYIGLGGDPDPTILEDWLQIYREDISFIFNNTNITDIVTTTLDPSVTDGYNDTNITGIPYDLVGICTNIPSHINVDILYADAGKTNDIPIYHIVGAKIGYTLSQWSLYCTAAGGESCHSDTDWVVRVTGENRDYVQSFEVSSSVNFIEVPNLVPERKSRYVATHSQNHFLCKHDTCWEEAFYPFTEGFRGDPYQYALSFSLVSVVFIIGLFMITRPWW